MSAALALGRQRKSVLLCDSGPRRNAAAVHLHNFVTRDGIPPQAFRDIAHRELEAYPSVERRDVAVKSVKGERGRFQLQLGDDAKPVTARRLLLCMGMVDERLHIPGYAELWGASIFQCPYCHGWEVKDRPMGFLVDAKHLDHALPFALQLRSLSDELSLFTNGAALPEDLMKAFANARIRVETGKIARFAESGGEMAAVELANGESIRCNVLFSHPPQRQVELVRALELPLDEFGFVKVDGMTRQTERPGIYAAGDLTTRMQGAVMAAAAGVHAAAMLNVDVMMELHAEGALR